MHNFQVSWETNASIARYSVPVDSVGKETAVNLFNFCVKVAEGVDPHLAFDEVWCVPSTGKFPPTLCEPQEDNDG